MRSLNFPALSVPPPELAQPQRQLIASTASPSNLLDAGGFQGPDSLGDQASGSRGGGHSRVCEFTLGTCKTPVLLTPRGPWTASPFFPVLPSPLTLGPIGFPHLFLLPLAPEPIPKGEPTRIVGWLGFQVRRAGRGSGIHSFNKHCVLALIEARVVSVDQD